MNLKRSVFHSPLNATISSVSVLQITAERTESLVEGDSTELCLFNEMAASVQR